MYRFGMTGPLLYEGKRSTGCGSTRFGMTGPLLYEGKRSTGCGSTRFGLKKKPNNKDYYLGKKIKIGPNGGHYIIKDNKKKYVPHDYHSSKDRKSNVLKYKKEKIPKDKFCGPSGGASKGSYPVNTNKRCSAALSYARFAPNPCGIARCVNKKCPKNIGKFSELMKKCNKKKNNY